MSRKSVFMGIALAAVLAVGCDRGDKPATTGEGGGLSGAANPEVRLSANEEQFVQKAAKGNKAEANMADMAENKAENPAVKEYAELLKKDHSNALDDLRDLASKANVKLDTEPPAEKASTHDRLEALSGKAFDSGYVQQMIEDHRTNIAAFEETQKTASGELKAFIDKMLPVMREHLQKAESLMEMEKK